MALLQRYNLENKTTNNTYDIKRHMDCGSYYHSAGAHKFTGSGSQVEKLINIMTSLGINIINKEPTSFVFQAKNRTLQKMMFKLARYVRSPHIEVILNTIIEAIKAGVNPVNALILGHYSTDIESVYYRSNMDIIPHTNNVKIGISMEEFNTRKSETVNYFFKTNRKKKRKDLTEIVKSKDYLAAEQFILN